MIREVLIKSGVSVEQREVIPGENLDAYDMIFVCMMPLSAIGSTSWYGAVWALYHSKDKCLVVVEDSRTRDHSSAIKYCNKDFDKRAFRKNIPRNYRDEALAVKDELHSQIDELDRNGYSRVILPLFKWWNRDKKDALGRAFINSEIIPIDPSHIILDVFPLCDCDSIVKNRAVVLAALSDVRKLLPDRNKWDCDIIGYGHWSTSSYASNDSTNKKTKIVSWEQEFIEYCRNYGTLSFPHKHSGLGWWRQRTVMAALAGAVYIGDDKETEDMGFAYHLTSFSRVQERFKKSSDKVLNKIIYHQRKWLFDNISSEHECAEILKGLIRI